MSERERAFRSSGTMTLSGGSHFPCPQIKVVKQPDSVIIPDRKASLLKRMADMESELGRMMKLLNEMRADATHLSVE